MSIELYLNLALVVTLFSISFISFGIHLRNSKKRTMGFKVRKWRR